MSFQCLTLTGIQLFGNFIENVCSFTINFPGSQCLGTGMTPYLTVIPRFIPQLYERCNVTRCCIINDVIPVRDTGIQFLLYSYLVYLFKIKFSGSQCQSTGMTPFLA
ncbi:hypothetical protein, partial [Wolbachia endosymbiont of Nomada ferruginata]|uniref:hypothetical protein n=2 Tax=unclassified Wolbachia TaxID=2640676 RepID=UPI00397C2C44